MCVRKPCAAPQKSGKHRLLVRGVEVRLGEEGPCQDSGWGGRSCPPGSPGRVMLLARRGRVRCQEPGAQWHVWLGRGHPHTTALAPSRLGRSQRDADGRSRWGPQRGTCFVRSLVGECLWVRGRSCAEGTAVVLGQAPGQTQLSSVLYLLGVQELGSDPCPARPSVWVRG